MRTFEVLKKALEQANTEDDVAALREVASELSLIDGIDARAAEHSARGKAYLHVGELGLSVENLQKSVDYCRELDDASELGLALLHLGYAVRKMGRTRDAMEAFSEGLDICRRAGNDTVAAHLDGALGVTSMMMGDLGTALKHVTAELDFSSQQNEQRGMLTAYGNLGMIHWKQGLIPEAIENLRRCLGIAEELGDRIAIALAHQNLGAVYSSIGNVPESLVEFNKAEQSYRNISNLDGISAIQANIGQLFIELGDYAQAESMLTKSLERSRETKNSWSTANDLDNLGICFIEQGNIEKAIEYASQSLEIYQELGMDPDVARVGARLGRFYVQAGNLPEARRVHEIAQNITLESPRDRISRDELKASILIADADATSAEAILNDAVKEASELGLIETEVQLRKQLRETAYIRGDLEAYARYTNEFVEISERIKNQGSLQRIAILEAERRASRDHDERIRERDMLYKTLPPDIATRALRGEDVSGDVHDDAAVMFLDTVGFTVNTSDLEPKQLTTILGAVFSQFDKICHDLDVIKIKTIGDAYLAVAFSTETSSGPSRAAAAAIAMMKASFKWPNGQPIAFRIGLHVGSIVAGVIGTERLQYDVWGDTVNVASRMESSGEAGKVHCSSRFADKVAGENILPGKIVKIVKRGEIEIKGKGTMTTYWLEGA